MKHMKFSLPINGLSFRRRQGHLDYFEQTITYRKWPLIVRFKFVLIFEFSKGHFTDY